MQSETLDLEVQLTLTQLYPLCEDIIIIVDLVGELTDIGKTLLFAVVVEGIQTADLMEDAVNEGRDAIDERELGALLQMAALIVFETQLAGSHIVLTLFNLVFELAVTAFLTLVQTVEEPQQEHQ